MFNWLTTLATCDPAGRPFTREQLALRRQWRGVWASWPRLTHEEQCRVVGYWRDRWQDTEWEGTVSRALDYLVAQRGEEVRPARRVAGKRRVVRR
jgi:hypothetical protein